MNGAVCGADDDDAVDESDAGDRGGRGGEGGRRGLPAPVATAGESFSVLVR